MILTGGLEDVVGKGAGIVDCDACGSTFGIFITGVVVGRLDVDAEGIIGGMVGITDDGADKKAIVLKSTSEEVREGHGWRRGKGGCDVLAADPLEAGNEDIVADLVVGNVLAESTNILDEAVGGAVLAKPAKLVDVVVDCLLRVEGGGEEGGSLEKGEGRKTSGVLVGRFGDPPAMGGVNKFVDSNGEPVDKGDVVEFESLLNAEKQFNLDFLHIPISGHAIRESIDSCFHVGEGCLDGCLYGGEHVEDGREVCDDGGVGSLFAYKFTGEIADKLGVDGGHVVIGRLNHGGGGKDAAVAAMAAAEVAAVDGAVAASAALREVLVCVNRLKFWHFEPSDGHDDATPEEQQKEFFSKLVARLVYTCNHLQSELEKQHQELANLRWAVWNHKDLHEDATRALHSHVQDLEQAAPGADTGEPNNAASTRQLEQRVDHVVAMLDDISTFIAPTTINEQLDTLKTDELPFLHLLREFYNRSCATLSLALDDREQYTTFAEIIDKAREIIKTNRAAAHKKSAWQPTHVEKGKLGPRPQPVAAVQPDNIVEDPVATPASREGDQVAAV
ncbi:hypothetical protein CBR_g8340 [Chara braunii]|uniref:Uncharacterized protein n=1 Tax=Chara braunii TaxID=69332 RepID=A0A388KLX3_CHABU|nr:hypothetical protein CBR_g8340 [Chara braunii]|eukprot:GBG71041.1 hypothetical protein CBR_g8340 [Chara braunii]